MNQRTVLRSLPFGVTILGLLVLTLSACWLGGGGASGSEHVSLRNGVLFTEWVLERAASGAEVESGVFHVLVIAPDLHQPGAGPHGSSSGGTPELSTFEVDFQLADGGEIKFAFEVEDGRWLKAAGQEFDLLQGNLVVCVLSRTEDPQVTQLSEPLPERADAATRLEAFQDQLDPDHPAQAVALYEWESGQ